MSNHSKFNITVMTHEFSETLSILNLLESLTKCNIDYSNRRLVGGENSLLYKH